MAAGGGLQKGVNPVDPPCLNANFTAENNVYSLLQKVVLIYIANFDLHELDIWI